MISINKIRKNDNKVIVIGNHEPLIQSMLDFDYLSQKKEASVLEIITGRSGFAKYFWGRSEILIPTFVSPKGFSLQEKGPQKGESLSSNLWFLNLSSGRRALSSTLELFTPKGLSLQERDPQKGESLMGFVGGAIFGENVPELHSLEIISTINHLPSTKLITGPASVGLLVPGSLKLGPIGGITPDQILETHLTEKGKVAVLSASGGMTSELINIAINSNHRLSFALSFGGDRFPILSPREAFELAEADPETETVLYYGELGGEDEYELIELKKEGKFTKQVIAHIAGTVASLFPESPQFGHAKAKADKEKVTATSKRKAMKEAGFEVSNSFSEFIDLVSKLNK